MGWRNYIPVAGLGLSLEFPDNVRRLAQDLRMCKLYVSTHRQAPQRPETGGGWRRTRVRRKRRWPNFIIWRWAGRAQGGWIHCLRRALPLRLLRRRRRPLTLMNRLRAGGANPEWVEAVPAPAGVPAQVDGRARVAGRGRRLPRGRPSAGAGKPPGKALRRAPVVRPSAAPSRPRRAAAVRPGRAPANLPPAPEAGNRLAGSPQAARVRAAPRPAVGPRKAGAGGNARPDSAFAVQPGECRGTVDQRNVGEGLGKVAEKFSSGRVDLLGVESDVIGVP
jgi:hypothetical protein